MYANIIQFFAQHRIVKRDAGKWRLTKEVVGGINGLGAEGSSGNFRGTVVATNGILCYIENESGQLFEGHLDWFVPDKKVPVETKEGVVIRAAPKQDLTAELLKLI